MSENDQPQELLDLRFFDENRSKYPPEKLLTYVGLFVAWSPDGTRILVSGESHDEVDDKLHAAGIHFSQVVHDYIDPPDSVFLG
jgi:hypothetical protein